MLIPSGILWSAIEIARDIPKVISLVEVRNVIIPSGTLWIINAIIDIIPTLYKLLFFSIIKKLSIEYVNMIPNVININRINNDGIISYIFIK